MAHVNDEAFNILIDCRKAFDAGIGTYIRNVVPRVLRGLPLVRARLIVTPGSISTHAWLESRQVECVECDAHPLSFVEQLALRRLAAPGEIFWATSLAHPLWRREPMVATVHDVAQLALESHAAGGRLTKVAVRIYLQSQRCAAGLMLFNSGFTEHEFRRYVGSPCGGTEVTPLGVAPAWFDAAPRLSTASVERPYFVCVGSIRPHKNLRNLLAAFALVLDQTPHDLIIVGRKDGFRTREGDLAQLLAPLGARVRFLGAVDESALRQLVAGAQALVFPSMYEGFGLPALEAMAAGCPVIAADNSALPEVCGAAARYFDPHSVEGLAAAMLECARMSPERRAAQVQNGRQRARLYTWDRTAELTVQALRRYARRIWEHG